MPIEPPRLIEPMNYAQSQTVGNGLVVNDTRQKKYVTSDVIDIGHIQLSDSLSENRDRNIKLAR